MIEKLREPDAVSTTLKSQVVEKLRDAILSGDYAPGEPLNESDLAYQFNTSRVPIREALIQLKEYGLVMSHKRRGMCVIQLSREDIQRINSVRIVLEAEAIWLVRERMTPEIEAQLRDIMARMANMANPQFDSPILDLAFHSAIWEASGNPYLGITLAPLVSRLFAHKALEHRNHARTALPHVREEMRVWRVAHHADLLDLLLGKSDADPEEAIVSHIRGGFDEPDKFSSLEIRKKRRK